MVDAFFVGGPGIGVRSTGATVVGQYSQPPTAGNLLVAIIKGGSTTSQSTTFSQFTGTTGWTPLAGNGNQSTFFARVEAWTKIAVGNDAPPTFNVFTGTTRAAQVTIYEIFNPNASPLDVSGVHGSGSTSTSITPSMIAVSTSANVTGNGELGLYAYAGVNPSTSGANGYTRGASFNGTGFQDGNVSSNVHMADDYAIAPAAGAALNSSPTITTFTGYSTSMVIVIKQGSATYPVGQAVVTTRLFAANSSGLTALSIANQGIAGPNNLIVLGTKISSTTLSVASISDSGAITTGWTRVAGPFADNESGNQRSHEMWIARTTGSGPTTINVVWSASNTGIATDYQALEFTTGYSWSTWARDGTQQGSQDNAVSTTHTWPTLTATVAGELWAGLCRAPTGGPFRSATAGAIAYLDSNNSTVLVQPGSPSGAITQSILDAVSIQSHVIGTLLRFTNTWPLSGSATFDTLDANASMGTLGTVVGSAPSASGASGTITRTALISGSAAPVSSASGTVGRAIATAGSAPSVSSAAGTMGAIVLVGSAPSVSSAAGTVTQASIVAGSSAANSAGATGVISRTAIITGSAASASLANGTLGLNGVLVGSAPSASAANGTIGQLSVLAGSSVTSSASNGAVVQIGVVAGSSATVGSATGALTRLQSVAGSSATTSQGSGDITLVSGPQVYPVAGSAPAVSLANGTIGASGVLVGSAASLSGAAGAVVLRAVASALSASASSASGSVVATLVLNGSSLASSSASGTMGLKGVLVGSAASASSGSGSLVVVPGGVTLTLAGSAPSVSGASGTVGRAIAVAGSAPSSSVAAGTVATALIVSGAAPSASAASGTVATLLSLSGAAPAVSVAAGTLATVLGAVGSSLTASSGSGTIALLGAVSGAATAISDASGAVSAALVLDGSAVSGSGADGQVVLLGILAGLGATASGADGTLGLPFIAGALPPKITAIVFVVSGPRVTIGVSAVSANIEVNSSLATVEESSTAGGVTIDSLHAEVT